MDGFSSRSCRKHSIDKYKKTAAPVEYATDVMLTRQATDPNGIECEAM
jgi:hypothetical protein